MGGTFTYNHYKTYIQRQGTIRFMGQRVRLGNGLKLEITPNGKNTLIAKHKPRFCKSPTVNLNIGFLKFAIGQRMSKIKEDEKIKINYGDKEYALILREDYFKVFFEGKLLWKRQLVIKYYQETLQRHLSLRPETPKEWLLFEQEGLLIIKTIMRESIGLPSFQSRLKAYDIISGKLIWNIGLHSPECEFFMTENKLIVHGSRVLIYVHDIRTGELLGTKLDPRRKI